MSETISPNTTLAHYSIVSKIGAGGMGEVYRARDSRLDRQFAIKILTKTLGNDADRLKRLSRKLAPLQRSTIQTFSSSTTLVDTTLHLTSLRSTDQRPKRQGINLERNDIS
ncbi:MAG TPA: hypothetical protein VFH91_02875 [Pyrinomonadaceae bacterium]|nr:hypothetical protein [Pyrinomonadaceae bacterium]